MRRVILSVLAFCFISTSFTYAQGSGATPSYSKGFSIEYRDGYKLVEVKSPWPEATRGFRYVLYKRGAPKPKGVEADGFFETPLRRAITFSTTYIPQIVALGEATSIVGVDSASYVSTSEVRARIKAGKVVETTRNTVPNIELMISLAPDAIFAYGMGNEWDSHPKMAEAGLPVIISGEWNEADPLARVEWIKFIAAFYNKEELATAIFEKTAKEYERVRALATSAKTRPTVLVNGPFQGTWSVSGGKSYMARFLSDAGATYFWADDSSTGGLTMSVEAVYTRALKADFWLNPALSVNSRADLVAMDARFAALPAVVAGKVWNNNAKMSPEGGNDYFESAVLHPDLVLVDLVKIFHPELLADRSFTYYKHVAR